LIDEESINVDIIFTHAELLEKIGWGVVCCCYTLTDLRNAKVKKILNIAVIALIVRDFWRDH
jgi:hypothetical protein